MDDVLIGRDAIHPDSPRQKGDLIVVELLKERGLPQLLNQRGVGGGGVAR